jgi:[ribosomal protein S18]-alanine N-acetyltransferase
MSGLLQKLFGKAEPAILEARPGDSAAIASVHSLSFVHGWSETEVERLMSDRATIGHVARLSGGSGPVVAFVLSHAVQDEAEILTIAVASQARGQGIAEKLLARHMGRLAARGVRKLFLEVDEKNTAACRLYARAGFAEVGRREGYYRRPEGNAAALTMRRDLV